MALLMLTFKMAEMFKDDGIKVNALQINGAKMSKRMIKKSNLGGDQSRGCKIYLFHQLHIWPITILKYAPPIHFNM